MNKWGAIDLRFLGIIIKFSSSNWQHNVFIGRIKSDWTYKLPLDGSLKCNCVDYFRAFKNFGLFGPVIWVRTKIFELSFRSTEHWNWKLLNILKTISNLNTQVYLPPKLATTVLFVLGSVQLICVCLFGARIL